MWWALGQWPIWPTGKSGAGISLDTRACSVFIDLKFFKMHPLLKPHNLFYSNGVAILSGFHDIPQNLSVGFTDVIN